MCYLVVRLFLEKTKLLSPKICPRFDLCCEMTISASVYLRGVNSSEQHEVNVPPRNQSIFFTLHSDTPAPSEGRLAGNFRRLFVYILLKNGLNYPENSHNVLHCNIKLAFVLTVYILLMFAPSLHVVKKKHDIHQFAQRQRVLNY